jgi:hypothetical protein
MMQSGLKIGGVFRVQVYNADGTLAHEESFKNGVTNAGLNHALSIELGGGTQVGTWYMGLINNAGFSSLAAADTMASHAGWTELTSYAEATREAISFAAASGQAITTSAVCEFTINATVAVNGAFINSVSTKGGTLGTLFAHGSFTSVQNLSSGQLLRVDYSCAAANV